MEVMGKSYMPGDPRLVEQLVYELKSQGIFDQFRRECIADVDTKPAYQNLRQRVEGSVTSFLKQQTWKPDMIKNQLREQLRKNIHESGYLEAGVERIVEQVVNPKINTVILPQVEDVAYRFLGIEKPIRNSTKKELEITISDLLPKDLEAVSPDSVHSFKYDRRIGDGDNMNQDSNLKAEDDESPPFELLIEPNIKHESHHLEDNSVDSHLSGFSGLQSHESSHSSDVKLLQADMLNMDYQVSQNDSEGRLPNIVSDEVIKMDICEDSLSYNDKTEASETKFDMMDVEKSEDNDEYTDDKHINNDVSHHTRDGDRNFDDKRIIEEVKKDDKILISDKKNDKNSDDKSSKHVSRDKNDKYIRSSNKSKSSKDNGSSRDKHKKDSKSSSSSIKEKDQKDKSRDKYKEKSNKSDRHTKEKPSKDEYNKSKDTVEKAKGDKIKEKSEKERDKSGKEKETEQEKDKRKSDHHKDKSDKGKGDSEKNREKNKNLEKLPKDVEKSSKSKEKLEKEMDEIDSEKNKEKGEKDQVNNMSRSEDKSKEKSDKSNSCKERERSRDKTELHKSKGKVEKDQVKASEGEEKLKEKSGKDDSYKEREKSRDKDRFSKGRHTREIDSSDKSKKDKEIDKDKSKSSSSKHKSGSSSKREASGTSSSANKSRSSSSSAKDKLKTGDHKSSNKSKSSGDKNTTNGKSSSSKKDGDRKRDPKKQSKDDHYGSKDKKHDRRSTDRDSNDGNSNRNNSTNSFTESSSSYMEKNEKEFSSSSGPVDSGNSDEVEPTSDPLEIEETMTSEVPPLKLTKPKFASNFQEAIKLMKIRKELVKLEKQNQLNRSLTKNVCEGLVNAKMQDNSENLHQSELPSESVDEGSFMTISVQPLKLTKPKFASNFQEARKLMKIRKQLAELEKQNRLGISSDLETGDQEPLNMDPVHTENTSEQAESSSEPLAGTIAIKPFKLNKPKFASNFQEARKLMKIRKQLAELERQNQHNMSANVSNIPGTSGDSENVNRMISESVARQPLKLNKPKFASNFREATKLMKIRKQLSKLEQENKLGFAEVSKSTEGGMYKADTDSNLPNGENLITGQDVMNKESSINEPLKGTELSQANWEALEARLAQEMSNINYNCYDEPYEYDDTGTSAMNTSTMKRREIKKNTSEKVEINPEELNSEDSQNDSMEFKGFKLEDNESNPTDFFKSYFGGDSQHSKISGAMIVPDIQIDGACTAANEHDAAKNNLNNNFKQLSVILDINALTNRNTEVDKEPQIEHSNDECRYLEQQSPNTGKKLQYLRNFIGMLEREIEYGKTELRNYVHQARGRKRKFEEYVDLRNNNKAYFEQTTVKKRGRPPGSNSERAKAVKMCNTSDILQNNSFPLPLSPAESDKSNDKKEEEIVVPAKQRRIANRASQRYSSEDLYKPRLVICRRSRGAKNNT